MWLEPGSTAKHLVFRIGRTVNHPGGVAVGVFRVDPCEFLDGSQPAWVAIDNTGDDKTDRIEYGILPSGFSERRRAASLRPGCYKARVSGSPGHVVFEVLRSGAVKAGANEAKS